MRGKGDKKGGAKVEIHIHKDEVIEGGHHGGAWKVAYADFVTAMMAFFLLMWLLNATTEDQRKGLADYFSPNSVLSHNSSGTGQPFGGRTAFSEGAMVSDLGAAQVTEGNHPPVDQVEEDEFGRYRPAAAASRRHPEQAAGPPGSIAPPTVRRNRRLPRGRNRPRRRRPRHIVRRRVTGGGKAERRAATADRG